MSELDDFSATVEALYRSSVEPMAWPAAMQRLIGYVDGSATVYLSSDPRTGHLIRSAVVGIDPYANQLYLEHFADKEVRIPGTLRAGVGEVVTEQDMVDIREFRRSEIYNELLMPYDIPHVMTVCTQRSEVESSNFVVERSFRQGPFEREQIERLGRLVPHLRLALQLRNICDDLHVSIRTLSHWLSDQRYALVALDARGCVLHLSPVARELVRQRRFIDVSQGRLRTHDAAENSTLTTAVRAATQHRSSHRSAGLRVKLTAAAEIAVADVLTVRDFGAVPDDRTVAMVIIRPTTPVAPSASAIGETLGVTPAEARLIRALYEIGQLEEVAAALHISIHTARTQLRSVFGKTECHNQAQLIRRVGGIATTSF